MRTILFIVLVVVMPMSYCQWDNEPTMAPWVDPPPRYRCPDRPTNPCNCTKGGEEGIFLECSNTNIASLALGLAQVRTLINTLTISNCNFEKLFGNVLKQLSVKRLVLVDTPIKDISDGTFDEVTAEAMEELYIRNTALTRLPPAIRNLTNLKILEIERSKIAYLPGGAFEGMEKLVNLTLANSAVAAVTPETFNGLTSLKRLSLYGNNLTDLPKSVFKSQGTNLEYLDVSHNGFTKLDPHYFSDLVKLLWLNASDNLLPEMNSRAFARNGLLTVVNLSGNKITNIDANSLRGMRFLRRLMLSDNEIKKVGRGVFKSVTRIGSVDLARNNLTKVDFQMFADLRFIDNVNLAENQITEIGKEAFKNIYLTTINISHNLLEEIGPQVFLNCENMTVLDLSHNNLRNIDPTAFDENSYTLEWDLTFNKFTSMGQIPMKHQRGIKILNVSHNEIVDIPKNYFPQLFELHTIDFSHNSISEIGRSVFGALFSLRTMSFRHNQLSDLESSTFGKLPSLLELDLSHNLLTSVKGGVLGGLTSLRSVFLEHNQIEDIPVPPISLNNIYMANNNISKIKGVQPWPAMNSLLFLDLDNNQLGDSIEPGRLDNLLTLGTLKLRGNGLTAPPWQALEALQSLTTLYLDDNMITNLSVRAFGRLPVVSVLGLSNNNINNISVGAFEGLLQLTNLDLSGNNLSFVPPGAFQSLVSVSKINLSNNNLESLQNKTHGLLDDCLSLRELDLSHNQIPFVTNKMFPESQWVPYKLEKIDLSYNAMPVLTRDILTGTKHLKHLNISYNMLNDIRKGVLGNLSSLEVLDISGNALTDENLNKPGMFGPLENLTVFNLHHNRFTELPVEALVQMKKLERLDVGYNKLNVFYPELMDQIKDRLDVIYEGNPLLCNCYLRPVAYWLSSVGRVKGRNVADTWDAAKCAGPKYLEDTPVGSLIEEQLICEDSEEAQKFKLNPDVQFRDLSERNNKLEFSWYVNTNEDVGDFRLELRTRKFPQTTLFERDLSYDTRYQLLDGVPGGEELNLCVLAKSSSGRLRRWRQDQCRKVGPFSGAMETKPRMWLLLPLLLLVKAVL